MHAAVAGFPHPRFSFFLSLYFYLVTVLQIVCFPLLDYFVLLLFATVLSQWNFSNGKFGCFPLGKPAASESRYPTHVFARWVCQCFNSASNSERTARIFNVPMRSFCTRIHTHEGTSVFLVVSSERLLLATESAQNLDSGEIAHSRRAQR